MIIIIIIIIIIVIIIIIKRKKVGLKVMLHGTICNDDFQRKTALQHCCDIVSNGCNIVPTLQRCVALKIVVANRPV